MNQSLSVSLAESSFERYWAYIVPVVTDDTMSLAQAADLIDKTYLVDSCDSSFDAWNQQSIEPPIPTSQNFDDAAAEFTSPSCDNSANVQAKIFYAYPQGAERYTLRIANGRLVSTIRKQETVTVFITVKNAEDVTLEQPVIRDLKMEWQNSDSAPELLIADNTIHWQGTETGTIKATYTTTYDLITIALESSETAYSDTLFGSFRGTRFLPENDDLEEAEECSVLLFYHYQYSGQILHRFEKDTSVKDVTLTAICGGHYAESVSTEDSEKPDCQETCEKYCPDDGGSAAKSKCISIRDKCLADCNGDPSCEYDCYDAFNACYRAAKSEVTEECRKACEEECDRDCYGQHNDIEICHCDTDVSSRNTELYEVSCEQEEATGTTRERDPAGIAYKDCGKRDKFWEPEYYHNTCPDEPDPVSGKLYVMGYFDLDITPNNLPWCEKMTRAFMPGQEPDSSTKLQLEEKYKNIAFIGVSPKDSNICGEYIVEQADPCGPDSPDVEWDSGSSVSVLAPGETGSVVVTGGTPPYVWKLSGKGFEFSNHRDNAETLQPGVAIIAKAEACGTANITVRDQCGKEAKGSVLSTEGEWCLVAYLSNPCLQYNYNEPCPHHILRSDNTGNSKFGCEGEVLAGACTSSESSEGVRIESASRYGLARETFGAGWLSDFPQQQKCSRYVTCDPSGCVPDRLEADCGFGTTKWMWPELLATQYDVSLWKCPVDCGAAVDVDDSEWAK